MVCLQLMTVQFENQKNELEKTLVAKKEKKKESMTLRLKEKEQRMTSSMVTKQSEQMLDLLAKKKEDLRKELEKELEEQVQYKKPGHNHNWPDVTLRNKYTAKKENECYLYLK